MKQSHTALLQWFKSHGRHELPWRNTDNIYHIYLSEVMLQQTQVNRVKEEYYPKFLKKFPTLQDLADASLEEVLANWSGLGYYKRASNLHKCAKTLQGKLPKNFKDLLQLPGIGEYTASAICSFGYKEAIVVVDTNIKRVLKRFFALKEVKEKTLLEKAQTFLNRENPREHNLALMDLGALVCTPKSPCCSLCPLTEKCQGKTSPEEFTKTLKKEYEALDLFFGVYTKNGKIALTFSKGNMYKDMLELPSTDPVDENFLGVFKHSYTKYRLSIYLYKIEESQQELVWVDLKKKSLLPISSLTKKALKILNL